MEQVSELINAQQQFEIDQRGSIFDDPTFQLFYEKVEMVKKILDGEVKKTEWVDIVPPKKKETKKKVNIASPSSSEKVESKPAANANVTAAAPANVTAQSNSTTPAAAKVATNNTQKAEAAPASNSSKSVNTT